MIKSIYYSIKTVFSLDALNAILYILCSIVSGLIAPLTVVWTAKSIEAITGYLSGVASFEIAIKNIIILLSLIAFDGVKSFINNFLSISLEKNISNKLSIKLIDKLGTTKWDKLADPTMQDDIKLMGSKPWSDIVRGFTSSFEFIEVIIKMLGLTIVLFSIYWLLGVVHFILIALDSFISFYTNKIMNEMFNNISATEREAENLYNILGNKSSLVELKIFGASDYIEDKYKKYNKKQFDERLGTTIKAQRTNLLGSVASVLWVIFLLGFSVWELVHGNISYGIFSALITLRSQSIDFGETIAFISWNFTDITKTVLAVKKILEIDCENNLDNTDNTVEDDRIIFKDVYFNYPNSTNEIFSGLDLVIDTNKTTAIVGANGAGKSTIVKLIAGLYKPSSGKVVVSGIDPYYADNIDLYKRLSIVYQDFMNYEMNLFDNITMGHGIEVNKEMLKLSGLEKYDYNPNIGKLYDDGIEISGGEAQRLAIARAINSPSKYLIFDEPTASMDPDYEENMYENIAEILKSRGALIISHRLVLTKLVDEIIVLEDGAIKERGSHDELMQACGLYQKMYNEQSSWYTDDQKAGEHRE